MNNLKITPEIKKKINEDMIKYKKQFEDACKLYDKYIKCFSKAYLSGSNLYVGEKLYYNNESLFKNIGVISFFISNKNEIMEFISQYESDLLDCIDRRFN